MLQLAPLLLAALPAQVQVEIVRLPSGGEAIASADGSWVTGGVFNGHGIYAGAFRWSSNGGLERVSGTSWGGVGISDDGQTVLAAAENSEGDLAAALWTPLGIQVLPGLGAALPAYSSFATALSRNGDFAAGVAVKPPVFFPTVRAVRWTSSGEVLELQTPGIDHSFAADLSDDGRVVVGDFGSPGSQSSGAALWLEGELHVLQRGGQAFGTSSDGAFVTGWDGARPWLWHRDQGLLNLDMLPPNHPPFFEVSKALQVTDDGQTVLCAQLYVVGGPNYLFGRSYLWSRGSGAVAASELFEALGAHELTAFDWLAVRSLSTDGRGLVGNAGNYGDSGEVVFWRAALPPVAEAYCTAQSSVAGCTPSLRFAGTPSARSGAGFEISAVDVPAGATAVLAYGTAGPASLPFGHGVLCVAEPTTRIALGAATGTDGCEGALAVDFNAVVARANDPALVGGARVHAQVWIHDPRTPNRLLHTDALAFTLWP